MISLKTPYKQEKQTLLMTYDANKKMCNMKINKR